MATSFWICASCEEGIHELEVLGDSRLALAAGGQNLLIYFKTESEPSEAEPGESSSVRTAEVSAAFSLGVLLRERGDLDEAERWWRRAKELRSVET